MEQFRESVKKGFASCKNDIDSLKEENSQLNETINSLNNEISTISNQLSEIKKMLLDKQSEVVVQKEIEKPIQKEISKDPYEALLAFKAKTNKKDMLKRKITSMISDNGMNLSELKFMFVDHFKYSSKATFYNYLKELELEKYIKIEREKSKNIIYLNLTNSI